ncbi:hypothetical protein NMY22_g8544 [Coprinellus aureogranulatus]|nr:hypothetical protein NMY22_g8544 [Coprinellus aureogranulatus]
MLASSSSAWRTYSSVSAGSSGSNAGLDGQVENKDLEPSENWKDRLKARIEGERASMETRLKECLEEDLRNRPQDKVRLLEDHQRVLKRIRLSAEDHFRSQLEQESKERKWAAAVSMEESVMPEAVMQEQEAIYAKFGLTRPLLQLLLRPPLPLDPPLRRSLRLHPKPPANPHHYRYEQPQHQVERINYTKEDIHKSPPLSPGVVCSILRYSVEDPVFKTSIQILPLLIKRQEQTGPESDVLGLYETPGFSLKRHMADLDPVTQDPSDTQDDLEIEYGFHWRSVVDFLLLEDGLNHVLACTLRQQGVDISAAAMTRSAVNRPRPPKQADYIGWSVLPLAEQLRIILVRTLTERLIDLHGLAIINDTLNIGAFVNSNMKACCTTSTIRLKIEDLIKALLARVRGKRGEKLSADGLYHFVFGEFVRLFIDDVVEPLVDDLHQILRMIRKEVVDLAIGALGSIPGFTFLKGDQLRELALRIVRNGMLWHKFKIEPIRPGKINTQFDAD